MSKTDANLILKDAYTLIAEQWCGPPEADEDREQVRKDAESVVDRVRGVAEEGAALLAKFLAESSLSEEDYVDLFELAPKCALYVGSHTYDEPHTCANAAVSDRNGYMIELGGIYRHFGHITDGRELPDYLPLMVDFLALTIESKDDTVRGKFIAEYFLPFLPPMHSRLEALKTSYLHLLEALERIINVDLKTQSLSKQPKQPVQPIQWEKTYERV
jgi:nitrate reductase molybdenum cofactor assembly chaperone